MAMEVVMTMLMLMMMMLMIMLTSDEDDDDYDDDESEDEDGLGPFLKAMAATSKLAFLFTHPITTRHISRGQ